MSSSETRKYNFPVVPCRTALCGGIILILLLLLMFVPRFITYVEDDELALLTNINAPVEMPPIERNFSGICEVNRILSENHALIRSPPGCTRGLSVGSICYFTCREHYNIDLMFGGGLSQCTPTGNWMPSIPMCEPNPTCPAISRYGLEYSSTCRNAVWETCTVQCTDGLVIYGPTSITCQFDQTWTVLPHCGCSPPLLPPNTSLQMPCDPYVGSECSIVCPQDHEMEGSSIMRCTKLGFWTDYPDCVRKCARIPLIEFLDTCTRRVGSSCRIRCSNGERPSTGDTIACLSSGIWNIIPDCRPGMHCPAELPEEAFLADNCTRLIGSVCAVECSKGFNLAGNNDFIKCLPGGHWSELPACVHSVVDRSWEMCIKSALPQGVVILGTCLPQRNKLSCDVGCIVDHELMWRKTVGCRPSGQWEDIPPCVKIIYEKCFSPVLSEDMVIIGSCFQMKNETCDVRCRQGKTLVGPQKITCLHSLTWTEFPTCIEPIDLEVKGPKIPCRHPELPTNVLLQDNCDVQKDQCKVTCLFQQKVLWLRKIYCLPNGKWTSLPPCNNEPLKDNERDAKACKMPIISINMELEQGCMFSVGSVCNLTCASGLETVESGKIMCTSLKKWVHVFEPVCLEPAKGVIANSLKDILCESPALPFGVKLLHNCMLIVHSVCHVACTEGLLLQGPSTIKCLSRKKWTPSPTCVHISTDESIQNTCSEPILSDKLAFRGECKQLQGYSCSLKCKDSRFTLVGNDAILCLPNKQWTKSPACVEKFCPNLSPLSHMVLLSYCTGIIGSKCPFACWNGNAVIGPYFLNCTSSGDWQGAEQCKDNSKSPQKVIKCPPTLGSGLMLAGACELNAESYCSVKCPDGFELSGATLIFCLKNGSWASPLPLCKKHVPTTCPVPILPGGMAFLGECIAEVGQSCKIVCTESKQGENEIYSIVCLSSGNWTAIPLCKGQVESSANKKGQTESSVANVGQTGVSVVNVGQTGVSVVNVGQTETSAVNVGQTETSAVNVGQAETSAVNVGQTETSAVNVGQTETSAVNLGQTESPSINKGQTESPIISISQIESSAANKGKADSCPEPKLEHGLRLLEDCRTSIGTSCRVECPDNMVLEGSDMIQCLPSGEWSAHPKCLDIHSIKVRNDIPDRDITCPELDFSSGLMLLSNKPCKRFVGASCTVGCKYGALRPFGHVKITCTSSGEWIGFPLCEAPPTTSTSLSCSDPEISNGVEVIGECPYDNNGILMCDLLCIMNNTILWVWKIKCLPSGLWSSSPNCPNSEFESPPATPGCSQPQLTGNAEVDDDCEMAFGSTCRVSCPEGFLLIGDSLITCLENGQWSDNPFCSESPSNVIAHILGSCPRPILSVGAVIESSCRLLIGQDCQVSCEHGLILDGPSQISCLKTRRWSELPRCVADRSADQDKFTSVDTRNTICSETHLPDYLKMTSDCEVEVDTISCQVECAPSYILEGSPIISCSKSSNKWSHLPKCLSKSLDFTCEPINLPNDLELITFCNHNPGSTCEIGCKNSMTLLGNNVITCSDSGEWSELPTCIPEEDSALIVCGEPDLPIHIEFKGSCNMELDVKCDVQCSKGYILKGPKHIVCHKDESWSQFPVCEKKARCPDIQVSDGLKLLEDCEPEESEVCVLACAPDMKLNGSPEVTCLPSGNWSEFPECIDKKELAHVDTEASNTTPIQDIVLPEISSNKCPQEEFYHNKVCYRTSKEKLNGYETATACKSPWRPLVIKNNSTYQFLIQIMQSKLIYCIWTGINDIEVKGLWKDSRGNVQKFLPWENGKPSLEKDKNGHFQKCVVMAKWDEYKFHDFHCYAINCHFICQHKV